MVNCSGLACVLSVLFTLLGEMISLIKYPLSRQLYFAYLGSIFHLSVVLAPNLGLMIVK